MKSSLLMSPLAVLPCLLGAAPAQVSLVGDWEVRLEAGTIGIGLRQVQVAAPVTLAVPPSVVLTVVDEPCSKLPLYNPKAGGWTRGARLRGVTCQECTARFQLDPASFRLKKGPGKAPEWTRGVDYEVDLEWGTFGRLEGGGIPPEATVYSDYRHGQSRLDSIMVQADGRVVLRPGTPHVANPKPPPPEGGALPVCNLYTTGRQTRLTEASLFPILELAYPVPPRPSPTPVERVLPKSLAKLRRGEPLRLIAWGDSVTQAGYLPHPDQRWQVQFVHALKERFPKADIELLHLGWGGRNTSSFLAEPPGSPYNYQEKLLDQKPDLVVSEFVNDAGLNEAQTRERYSRLLADFQKIGAEWLILTPHYTRPDWMGLAQERDCDDDPRAYVQALRRWAAENPVGLADASRRYGRLWRQGIPYNTLMLNAINHPDGQGMGIFAAALMELFPER